MTPPVSTGFDGEFVTDFDTVGVGEDVADFDDEAETVGEVETVGEGGELKVWDRVRLDVGEVFHVGLSSGLAWDDAVDGVPEALG